MRTVERFRLANGFDLLSRYIVQKTGTAFFPDLEVLAQVLVAVCEAMIPSRAVPAGTTDQGPTYKQLEDDAILVAKSVMHFIRNADDGALKKISTDQLAEIQRDLQRIFDKLTSTRRDLTNEYYEFWRTLALKLITSKSLPLKLFGWEQVDDMIKACSEHRPPPRSFNVTNAGCPYVNGSYEYVGPMTEDGYAKTPTGDISYVRAIPEGEEGGGKKLTLFRCTMRSQQKWWFLSEADEEQPGTDRDIDYYQHKSKAHEEGLPPPTGWITCRNAGVDPPPLLEAEGLVVPPGKEYETLEHQLAKWAIENEIVEQVLGDTTIHREVVSRSTLLIKFLTEMCDRYPPSTAMTDVTESEPKRYCLQSSHLLFAWKTCLRKADAAVSSQVYQLLVTILPLCPADLAIPLLKAVQTSLHESQDKRNYLSEVSEFSSALAQGNVVDAKDGTPLLLKEEVREEVLNLLWSVLTHPDASSLRSYDTVKRYVTHELRVEPKGREHREKFLKSCVMALVDNSKQDTPVDEIQALRMVKLTHFVIEACPRDQADSLVKENSGYLPRLLFGELVAYLSRRKLGVHTGFVRKASTISQASSSAEAVSSQPHLIALNERLRILRHLYGLSENQPLQQQQQQQQPLQQQQSAPSSNNDAVHTVPASNPGPTMTYEMLSKLWELCDAPEDRAALMVFIASASHNGTVSHYENVGTPSNPSTQTCASEQALSAAFPDDVCRSIFVGLFCSPSFRYEYIEPNAYRSFQYLFTMARHSQSYSSEMKGIALDALWRICLTVVHDAVASQAMKDLLSVYIASTAAKANGQAYVTEQMVTDEPHENGFGERVFLCLSRVKDDLEAGKESASRSAERCLRILNASIGQNRLDGHSMTSSCLVRLSTLDPNIAKLEDVYKCLPHGLRGQSSYRRVSILAKRPTQSQAGQTPVPAKDSGNNPNRVPSTSRFTLDLHPLETLASVKAKVSEVCRCAVTSVRPIQVNGRAQGAAIRPTGESPQHMNLNVVPEDSVVDEIGIVEGCEMVFVITDRPVQNNATLPTPKAAREAYSNDLSAVFFSDDGKLTDKLFAMLLGILKSLPWKPCDDMSDTDDSLSRGTHKLVWDFLLAMPTDSSVASRVKSAQVRSGDEPSVASEDDAMEVEHGFESWNQLLDVKNFDRSVYVLLTIDAFLRPAKEAVSILPDDLRQSLQQKMDSDSTAFRRFFIEAGGFDAVVRFFAASEGSDDAKRGKTRRGNAVALRVLKSCLFGDTGLTRNEGDDLPTAPDEVGRRLLDSLSDAEGLLISLTSMVVNDPGISSSTISDVLRFLRLLFQSPRAAQSFVTLPDGSPERFLVIPLLHDEEPESSRTTSSISATMHVRKSAHHLILQTPILADSALPWLIKAIDKIDIASESTGEYFDVLEKLVADTNSTARSGNASDKELLELGTMVCKKLASCPRPASESDTIDFSTGVLCGCLRLLRALIEHGSCEVLRPGTNALLHDLGVSRWSESAKASNTSALSIVSSSFTASSQGSDGILIDLIGAIFDGFLTPGGPAAVAICCDRDSRRLGFDVVGAATKQCRGADGYMALVNRISGLITAATPNLRGRWDQFGGGSGEPNARTKMASKYSGLRNQGCTCYMNSVLQQLFMMPELRDSMCSAPIPTALRSTGGIASKGSELVGKTISLQWENGVSYDAIVEAFNESTGTHTIRYLPIQVAAVSGMGQQSQQIDPDEINRLPPQLPDEFILAEGRTGKETGAIELVKNTAVAVVDGDTAENIADSTPPSEPSQETEDESASRHLLEEVQRTFIHLAEGSRGRCFDPRALVEACACLKLEFDVWQQNDASEFTTKLLDRLEISLKKYAPSHFRYMDNTFGFKQAKQKICKECGLKTNREEKLLNIDCQIRGKTDIHEALAAMTETEIMEGSNKVFCDRCKKNTDTILRTAISTLPNMLILSLKRFDLDFTTFETVKVNSRCAFADTLNMRQYTLEGLEAVENLHQSVRVDDESPMETEEEPLEQDGSSNLSDGDCEYRLAGVLVHAGVAQGGHYYSFIKDRNPGSEDKWYRFDDEDVTPFDPKLIETECFGGKIKKESKWPNGTLNVVEQDQFANALMLFYEKVKQSEPPPSESADEELASVATSSGYDVFKADVRRSNTTHMWQSFLFDSEFQVFLKGLLTMCRRTFDYIAPADLSDASLWRGPVLQMLLTFVFDVMLYSSDRSHLGDWTTIFEEVLHFDKQTGRFLVHTLARKSREVSPNWLRTYLLDCPDQASRAASVQIFSASIHGCISSDVEIQALQRWARAWNEQLAGSAPNSAMPCSLQQQWSTLEDTDKMETGEASSIGIIISFLNVLLEAMPRSSRFSAEVFTFIRHLATVPEFFEKAGPALRQALVSALIPPRLVALAARDRLHPSALRLAFPGASVSPEVANTQARQESHHTAHVMPIGGNHMMHNAEVHNPRIPVTSDYQALLEALACIAEIPGVVQAPLLIDSGEIARNRRRFQLSEEATEALTTVFQEFSSDGGMGQREVESYLCRTRNDAAQYSGQRIMEMLNKYSPNQAGGALGGAYLELSGFLAYYRDAVQTNDVTLRSDLHHLGFRPDLSRRSDSARFMVVGERMSPRTAAASIAVDVAECLGRGHAMFGKLAHSALLQTFPIYSIAFGVHESLALYLVAGAAFRHECGILIDRTLSALFSSHSNEWAAGDTVAYANSTLQVIAELPDDMQNSRIAKIMESNTAASRDTENGLGLLHVLRFLQRARQTQPYHSDVQWMYGRYIDAVRSLRRSTATFGWLEAHPQSWAFAQREITDTRSHNVIQQPHHQVRGDYGTRDYVGALDHHGNSDSDDAMNDSGDDEDSQFDMGDNCEGSTPNDGPFEIVVAGAGNDVVNGAYYQSGYYQGACKYEMESMHNGRKEKVWIFQCTVSNNTSHWYISIVPNGVKPGTSSDIDFYSAPMTDECRRVPPMAGWLKAQQGVDPPPMIRYQDKPRDAGAPNGPGGVMWNGTVEDDENNVDDRNPSYYSTN